jgi:hypothetical protein
VEKRSGRKRNQDYKDMIEKPLITRKELSERINLSTAVIARNEKTLGLSNCKVVVNKRVILYRANEALRIAGITTSNNSR